MREGEGNCVGLPTLTTRRRNMRRRGCAPWAVIERDGRDGDVRRPAPQRRVEGRQEAAVLPAAALIRLGVPLQRRNGISGKPCVFCQATPPNTTYRRQSMHRQGAQ